MDAQKSQMNCLTFDVEEHFQVSAFDSPIRRRHWSMYESRVERNTDKVLTILHEHQIRATFFVLGWIAERHPALIRRITAAGHEIASHGYAHELILNQTKHEFRQDVKKTKAILEDMTGNTVIGYRAPSFMINRETQWTLEILVEEGYIYDASIFPIIHDRYGWPDATPWVHQIHTPAGIIWEIPPSTTKVGAWRLPIAGGGYLRLFPYGVMHRLLTRERRGGNPLVMYLHPWELDPDQPEMKGPWMSRFRHYVNLCKTEERLTQLLQDFTFSSLCEVIEPIRRWYHEQRRPMNGYAVQSQSQAQTKDMSLLRSKMSRSSLP